MDKAKILQEDEVLNYPGLETEIPGQNATLKMDVAIQNKKSDKPGHGLTFSNSFQALSSSFTGMVVDAERAPKSLENLSSEAIVAMTTERGWQPGDDDLLSEEIAIQRTSEDLVAANSKIFKLNQNSEEPTTVSAVVAKLCKSEGGMKAVVGWLGDSRAYLVSPDGQIEQITVDDNICTDACGGDLELAKEWQTKFQKAGLQGFRETFMEFYQSVPHTAYVDLIKTALDQGMDEAEIRKKFSQTITSLGAKENVAPHVVTVKVQPGCKILLVNNGVTDALPKEKLNQESTDLVKEAGLGSGLPPGYNEDRVALTMKISAKS